jgi:hypothetical protein
MRHLGVECATGKESKLAEPSMHGRKAGKADSAWLACASP